MTTLDDTTDENGAFTGDRYERLIKSCALLAEDENLVDADPPYNAEARASNGAGSPASKEVSWWATHVFIEAAVAQANYGPLPTAGTPAWTELAEGDPRKLLALAVAGEHHVLRMQIAQEVRAQAAEDVWGGEDWSQVARQVQKRREIDDLRRSA